MEHTIMQYPCLVTCLKGFLFGVHCLCIFVGKKLPVLAEEYGVGLGSGVYLHLECLDFLFCYKLQSCEECGVFICCCVFDEVTFFKE